MSDYLADMITIATIVMSFPTQGITNRMKLTIMIMTQIFCPSCFAAIFIICYLDGVVFCSQNLSGQSTRIDVCYFLLYSMVFA